MQQYNDDHGHNEPTKLIHFIEDVERLEGLKATIQQEIREKKQAAHAAGFEMKAFNQMLKERKMSASERDEWAAICDLMRAELGMLGDTPLGDAARRRFERSYAPPKEQRQDHPEQDEGDAPGASQPQDGSPATGQPDAPRTAKRPSAPALSPEEIEAQRQKEIDEARQKGREAARRFLETKDPKSGILANPYLFPDPRRAAWDAAYCQETGSDGMDLPPHLKRSEKPKGKPGRPKKDKGQDGKDDDKGGE